MDEEMIESQGVDGLMKLIGAVFLRAKRLGRLVFAGLPNDLTPEQLWALIMISKSNILHIKELAAFCDRENTTTSRMIDGLERRSLVVRVPDQNDQRRRRVCLTHAGRECVDQARSLLHGFYRGMMEGISPDELKVVNTVLSKVLRNFTETGKFFT